MLRRTLRVVLIALLGVVALAVLAWVFRRPLFGGLVARAIEAQLQAAVGGTWSVGEIGGSWLRDVVIEDVRLVAPTETQALREAQVPAIRASYDLIDLLRGEGAAAISLIRVEGVTAALDLDRSGDTPTQGLPDLRGPPLDMQLPDLRVSGALMLRVAEKQVDLGEVVLESTSDDRLRIALREIQVAGEAVDGRLEGLLDRRGERQLRWTSTTSVAGVSLPTAVWFLDGRVIASLRAPGGVISIEADANAIEAQTEGLDLAPMPAWIRAFAPESPGWPDGGRLEARVRIRDLAGPEASVSLETRNLAWAEQRLDVVDARIEVSSAGVISIEQLDVLAQEGTASVTGAVLDPAFPYLLRNAKRVVVDIRDLRAFAPDLDEAIAIEIEAGDANGRRLAVQTLRATSPRGMLEGRGWLELTEDPARWRESRVELSLTGRVADLGRWVEELQGGVEIELEAVGPIETVDVTLDIRGRDARWGNLRLDRLQGRTHVPPTGTRTLDATLETPAGTIQGQGPFEPDPFGFALAFSLNAPDLGILTKALELDAMGLGGRASVSGRLVLQDGHWHIEGDVEGRGLAQGEQQIGDVDARVSFDERTLGVDRLEATGPWGRAGGSAVWTLERDILDVERLSAEVGGTKARLGAPLRVRVGDEAIETERLVVEIADGVLETGAVLRPSARTLRLGPTTWRQEDRRVVLTDGATLTQVDDDVIRIAGLGARIDDSLDVKTALTIDVAAREARIETLALETPDWKTQLERPALVTLEGDLVRLRDIEAVVADVRILTDATVDLERERVRVDALRARTGEHEARLQSPAIVRRDGERILLEGLDAVALGARIRGAAGYGETLTADLHVEGLDLQRIHPELPGRAYAHLVMTDKGARLDAMVSALAWQHLTGDMRVGLRQGPEGGIEVETLLLEGSRGTHVEGRASLPYRISPKGLEHLADHVSSLRLDGSLPLPSELEGERVVLAVEGDAEGLRARFTVADVILGEANDPRDDAEIRLDLRPERATASVRLLSDAAVKVLGTASLDRGIDWRAPQDLAELGEARLEGRLEAEIVDWEPLRKVLPRVRTLSGKARASIDVEGPLKALVPTGMLELEALEAKLAEDLPTLSDVSGKLVWRDGDVEIASLQGELGYAPFRVEGGVKNALADDRRLDLRVVGEYLLLARNESMRLRSDLDLRLEGQMSALTLSGKAAIRDLLYIEPVSLSGSAPATTTTSGKGVTLVSFEDEPLRSLELDLDIQAPNTIRIRNNLLRGNASVDLRIRGTGLSPEPEGRIVSRGASVYLPANSLRVDAAEVIFAPGEPNRPRLLATARTRASGYSLGVRASGELPDIEISVFSRPRLSDEDAMLLLATGAVGGGGGGGAGVESLTLQRVFEFFGDNLLSFARGSADAEARPFFDRFTLTVGRQTTRKGLDTIESDIEIADRIYFYGERDIYDETNLGFIWRLRFR